MATIKPYSFSRLQNAWEQNPNGTPLTARQKQSIDYDSEENIQKKPDDFTKVESGGGAFVALAEANKGVDQSELINKRRAQITQDLAQKTAEAKKQFDAFKLANPEYSQVTNYSDLINGNEEQRKLWDKLSEENKNKFSDSVDENANDSQIQSLNSNFDAFLDPSATQGNRALDSYLLGQSGAANKLKAELVNTANSEKANINALSGQGDDYIRDVVEKGRKEKLKDAINMLRGNVTTMDAEAVAASVAARAQRAKELEGYANQEKAKISEALNAKKLEFAARVKAEKDRIDGTAGQNSTPESRLAAKQALDASQYQAFLNYDAEAKKAQDGIAVKDDSAISDKLYSTAQLDRFSKIKSLLVDKKVNDLGEKSAGSVGAAQFGSNRDAQLGKVADQQMAQYTLQRHEPTVGTKVTELAKDMVDDLDHTVNNWGGEEGLRETLKVGGLNKVGKGWSKAKKKFGW